MIGSWTTAHPIISCKAQKSIVTWATLHSIPSIRADDQVIASTAEHSSASNIVEHEWRDKELLSSSVERVVTLGSEEKIEAIAADQHVAAKPTAEDIVTCETIDEVVTLQARDDVASRCPDQDVVAGSSHDRGDFTSAQNALLGPQQMQQVAKRSLPTPKEHQAIGSARPFFPQSDCLNSLCHKANLVHLVGDRSIKPFSATPFLIFTK